MFTIRFFFFFFFKLRVIKRMQSGKIESCGKVVDAFCLQFSSGFTVLTIVWIAAVEPSGKWNVHHEHVFIMHRQCKMSHCNCKKATDWSCLPCLYATKLRTVYCKCFLDDYIQIHILFSCTNSSKYLLILLYFFVLYMSGKS